MQPIDIFVLLLAVLCVFYVPFLAAQLVMKLLSGPRRQVPGRSAGMVDLTDSLRPARSSEPLAPVAMLDLTDANSDAPSAIDGFHGSPVPDVEGLMRYLTDERASDADALLVTLLDQPDLVSHQR